MKKFNRIASGVLAAALVVSGITVLAPSQAKADPVYKVDASAGNVIDASYKLTDPTTVSFTVSGGATGTATLGLADAGWSYQDWESSVDVTGDGTYTITSKSAEDAGAEISDGVVVFVVDIAVGSEAFDVTTTDYVISDVKVNDTAVNFIYGDLEEKGNLRIEIYNEYGNTKSNESIWEEAKAYVADTTAGNIVDSSFAITDPLTVSFDVAGVDSANAVLGLADASWSYQDWESSVAISGDGTYTITSKSAEDAGAEIADGVVVFVVDIQVGSEAFMISDTDYVVSNVKVNDTAVNFIYGDLEEKGNLRIEIYNEYGPTNTDETVWGGEATASEETTVEVGTTDLDGTYNGYIYFQSPSYSFRNEFYEENYGRDAADGSFFKQITGWDGSDAITIPGTLTDAVIAGNGTYKVSATEIEFASDDFSDSTVDGMRFIGLSTDIPNDGAITISDIKLYVNGSLVEDVSPVINEDAAYLTISCVNTYDSDHPENQTTGYYAVPVTDMEIEFTVSGFNYDNTAADTADTAAAETATEEASSSNVVVIIVIVCVVVVAAVVVIVLVAKKNKKAE